MSADEAKEYAKSMLGDFGFGANEFDSLNRLWQAESGWNYKAMNRSGAAGIPQLMGGKNVPNFMNDYKTQVEHGLSYIKKRYGSPTNAWEFFQKQKWY